MLFYCSKQHDDALASKHVVKTTFAPAMQEEVTGSVIPGAMKTMRCFAALIKLISAASSTAQKVLISFSPLPSASPPNSNGGH